MDAQADLSLLWAHSHFVGFDMRRLINVLSDIQSIQPTFLNINETAIVFEGLDGGGGVWNSLISKNLAHYSLSLKYLLIL